MSRAAAMTAAPDAPRNATGLKALLRHGAFVVSDNPVTGLSFALFVLLALIAIFGPWIAPHDAFASDTAAALQKPSLHHLFGTDQLGRDIFSRVLVATRLDMTIAIASVALVFALGGIAGVREVHELHVWSISSGLVSLSCHLVAESGAAGVLDRAREVLRERFEIHHVTIQVEQDSCGGDGHA